MSNLLNWIKEHFRELFWYGFFGVITTIVNIVVFYLLDTVCGLHYMIANVAAWIVAVAVAFVTNKIWVFDSKSWKKDVWMKECVEFVSARLLSGAVDIVIMFVGISILRFEEMWVKIVANVIVIICNYVLSKLWVFRKRSS